MSYPTKKVVINGVDIVVHFDDLQIELLDAIEHDKTYKATGFDANGRTYTACAEFSCGELLDITDIEQD